MDGLGFSLYAAPLDVVGSCIPEYTESEPQKGCVRQMGGTEVWCIPDWSQSGSEGLVSKGSNLVNIQTDSTLH